MDDTNAYLEDLPIAGTLVGQNFDKWPDILRNEFDTNSHNGRVGQRLLMESGRVRVWSIDLEAGERVEAHRHVLDYFWTAVCAGTSSQHTHDGSTRKVHYEAGETRYYSFSKGEYLLHDLENIGDEPLSFVTVEFLDSANAPISLHADR